MEALVRNLIDGLPAKHRHARLDGPGDEAGGACQARPDVASKIGYPKRWRDYSALVIVRDDLVGNVMRAREFEYRRGLAKLGKPVDRDEWGMNAADGQRLLQRRR